jgi:hypothetical protein
MSLTDFIETQIMEVSGFIQVARDSKQKFSGKIKI